MLPAAVSLIMRTALLACLLFASVWGGVAVAGDVPQVMNFQGRLDGDDGAPVRDSTYTIDFRLFDNLTGGNLLWDETQQVPTQYGVFSVVLGAVTPIPAGVFDADSCFLEVEPIGFGPIVPRARLTSVAYARRAADADRLDGATADELEESEEIQDAITVHQLLPHAHHSKTVSADELITGTLDEDRLPQNAIDSSEIQNNSLYAADMADEAGIAHSFTSLKLLTVSVSVLDSAYLIAPEFGYVLVIATGWFYENHVSADVSAILSLSTARDAIDFDHTARFEVRATAPAGHTVEDFALQRVLTVTKGQQVKLFLVGQRTGTGMPNVENIHINALYFPTSYGEIDNPAAE